MTSNFLAPAHPDPVSPNLCFPQRIHVFSALSFPFFDANGKSIDKEYLDQMYFKSLEKCKKVKTKIRASSTFALELADALFDESDKNKCLKDRNVERVRWMENVLIVYFPTQFLEDRNAQWKHARENIDAQKRKKLASGSRKRGVSHPCFVKRCTLLHHKPVSLVKTISMTGFKVCGLDRKFCPKVKFPITLFNCFQNSSTELHHSVDGLSFSGSSASSASSENSADGYVFIHLTESSNPESGHAGNFDSNTFQEQNFVVIEEIGKLPTEMSTEYVPSYPTFY